MCVRELACLSLGRDPDQLYVWLDPFPGFVFVILLNQCELNKATQLVDKKYDPQHVQFSYFQTEQAAIINYNLKRLLSPDVSASVVCACWGQLRPFASFALSRRRKGEKLLAAVGVSCNSRLPSAGAPFQGY